MDDDDDDDDDVYVYNVDDVVEGDSSRPAAVVLFRYLVFISYSRDMGTVAFQ